MFIRFQSPNLGHVVGPYPGGGGTHGNMFGAPIDLREPHGHLAHQDGSKDVKDDERLSSDLAQHSVLAAQSGITRQQLINRFVSPPRGERGILALVLASLEAQTMPRTPKHVANSEFVHEMKHFLSI